MGDEREVKTVHWVDPHGYGHAQIGAKEGADSWRLVPFLIFIPQYRGHYEEGL